MTWPLSVLTLPGHQRAAREYGAGDSWRTEMPESRPVKPVAKECAMRTVAPSEVAMFWEEDVW